MMIPPPPPAVYAAAQAPPPLEVIGYRPGMAVAQIRKLIVASGGTFSCKGTTDPRMKDCTGTLPFPQADPYFRVLVSSVKDSAAVIVFSVTGTHAYSQNIVPALTEQFGKPNYEVQREGGIQESWQWIRRGQMIRLVERKAGLMLEASITLTDGPLLDGLGPPKLKKPGDH